MDRTQIKEALVKRRALLIAPFAFFGIVAASSWNSGPKPISDPNEEVSILEFGDDGERAGSRTVKKIEDVRDFDNSAEQRSGVAVFPTRVNARSYGQQLRHTGLSQFARRAEFSEPLVEVRRVPIERER